mmetsp:Transcript_43241/g.119571  ORF Transcript_43241/g.119571 Transcript_43241/m.119571 type:complete len:297 (+) Transcript_43241:1258-2148(+)
MLRAAIPSAACRSARSKTMDWSKSTAAFRPIARTAASRSSTSRPSAVRSCWVCRSASSLALKRASSAARISRCSACVLSSPASASAFDVASARAPTASAVSPSAACACRALRVRLSSTLEASARISAWSEEVMVSRKDDSATNFSSSTAACRLDSLTAAATSATCRRNSTSSLRSSVHRSVPDSSCARSRSSKASSPTSTVMCGGPSKCCASPAALLARATSLSLRRGAPSGPTRSKAELRPKAPATRPFNCSNVSSGRTGIASALPQRLTLNIDGSSPGALPPVPSSPAGAALAG